MNRLKILTLSLLVLFMASCGDDDVLGSPGSKDQVKNWASSDVIAAMEGLGFIIHEGEDPPNINGVFRIDTRVLESTNVPGDNIGDVYADSELTFSDQNNSNLTVDFVNREYSVNNGSLIGTATVNDHIANSYITGSGDQFTAFFKTETTLGANTATILEAFTGKLGANGITEFKSALFMLDDQGSQSGIFIENNQGRVFKDQDGTVEKM